MFGRKVFCVRCINCSQNNTAKGIRLHDKIAIYILQEKVQQVRAFESNISLMNKKENVVRTPRHNFLDLHMNFILNKRTS